MNHVTQLLIASGFLLAYGTKHNDPYHWIVSGAAFVAILFVKLAIHLKSQPMKPVASRRGARSTISSHRRFAGTKSRTMSEAWFMTVGKGIIYGLLALLIAVALAWGVSLIKPVYNLFYSEQFLAVQHDVELLETQGAYEGAIQRIDEGLTENFDEANNQWLKQKKLELMISWGEKLTGDAAKDKFDEAVTYAEDNKLDATEAKLRRQLAEPTPTLQPTPTTVVVYQTPIPTPIALRKDLPAYSSGKVNAATQYGAAVVVSISVVDVNGDFIEGLTKDDFAVIADGQLVPPHMINVSTENDVQIGCHNLVIDISGSMKDPKFDGDEIPIDVAVSAATSFAGLIRDTDLVRVNLISTKPIIGSWGTPDEAEAFIQTIKSKGDTAFWDTMQASMGDINPRCDYVDTTVLSDGLDTTSERKDGTGIVINGMLYVVAIPSDKFTEADQEAFRNFTVDHGGMFYVADSSQLVTVFEEIAKRTQQSYVLTYVGSAKKLEITVGGQNAVILNAEVKTK